MFILDSLAKYSPVDGREAEGIIERVTPRLQHANSAVVMSAVKVTCTRWTTETSFRIKHLPIFYETVSPTFFLQDYLCLVLLKVSPSSRKVVDYLFMWFRTSTVLQNVCQNIEYHTRCTIVTEKNEKEIGYLLQISWICYFVVSPVLAVA